MKCDNLTLNKQGINGKYNIQTIPPANTPSTHAESQKSSPK